MEEAGEETGGHPGGSLGSCFVSFWTSEKTRKPPLGLLKDRQDPRLLRVFCLFRQFQGIPVVLRRWQAIKLPDQPTRGKFHAPGLSVLPPGRVARSETNDCELRHTLGYWRSSSVHHLEARWVPWGGLNSARVKFSGIPETRFIVEFQTQSRARSRFGRVPRGPGGSIGPPRSTEGGSYRFCGGDYFKNTRLVLSFHPPYIARRPPRMSSSASTWCPITSHEVPSSDVVRCPSCGYQACHECTQQILDRPTGAFRGGRLHEMP